MPSPAYRTSSARPSRSARAAAVIAALALAVTAVAALATRRAHAQVQPIYSRGTAGLVQQLEALRTTASVIQTGAHPDDEDSALIATLARHDHARTAYLSLTRGEGGQNIIGPDLFDALGIIRTEELLQARTLDGADQLFTRAYDFGFTKTMAEADQRWGEQNVLADMVRDIRLYRPLVLISRFSGTPADGHGQHQVAGQITPLAYKDAGDPTKFPEQLAEGLRVWQPRKFYMEQGFRPSPSNRPTLEIQTGNWEPLLGRTDFEIAMQGRSQHKTQGMGALQLRGPHESGLRLVASTVPTPATEHSLFDGLDTSITGLGTLMGLPGDALRAQLAPVQQAADRALQQFEPLHPGRIVPTLAAGLRAVRAARAALASAPGTAAERADVDFVLAHEEQGFEHALAEAAGVTIDALSDTETVTPGASFTLAVRSYVADKPLVHIGDATVRAPAGWTVAPVTTPEAEPTGPFARFFREIPDREQRFRLTVAADARPTEPYWLEQPRHGDLYTWPAGSPKGRPFAPPIVNAAVSLEIGRVPVTIVRPVQYRYADRVRGELRRLVNVVPALSIGFDSKLDLVPADTLGRPQKVSVRLTSNAKTPLAGQVHLTVPSGWRVTPAAVPFDLRTEGAETALAFEIAPPAGTPIGQYTIRAIGTVGGRTYDQTMRTIAYPHIQTHRMYEPAAATVDVLHLAVAPVRVGYIMGSGDDVPDALRRMGLSVTMLDPDYLSAGDLSRFDTIVVGIRASQTRPDFVANMDRLLGYVRNGGTLIVQYQQPDYVDRKLTPFPAQMASRVVDEDATMTILQPTHPLFTFPNRIGPDDWKGWVQERDLYSFTTFDPRYVPLLQCHDPGEGPQDGGEVYARLGKGNYVYTSYSWFRQLPAGVPGAYRLFANLVSLAKAPAWQRPGGGGER
ncbi:MAG: PIG-L family deacetylase [Acidobacteriota bacterium]|nr:PIG-L family deacetylase [Acidobacteriota bacterium]